MTSKRQNDKDAQVPTEKMTSVLATLNAGDHLPWKLDRNGEPQWLTVVSVDGPGVHRVRYPDGHIEPLYDTH